MKIRIIESIEDADELTSAVARSADAALANLAKICSPTKNGLSALQTVKFSPVGFDPLNEQRSLNFIEQLNQSFTYIASAKAAKLLLQLHPEFAPYTLNLGTTRGYDIESSDRDNLVAEVFAAVDPRNNKKLEKDKDKLRKCHSRHKYIFFMSPTHPTQEMIEFLQNDNIRIWAIGTSLPNP